MRLHRDDIKNIYDAKGTPTLRLLDSRGNEIWSKTGESDWQLELSDYVLGSDGKYYEKWVDRTKAISNNPIIDLNDNEWVKEMTEGNLDFYMSDSNHEVAGPNYSQFCVRWSGLRFITFECHPGSNSPGANYLVIGGLDSPKFETQPTENTQGIYTHLKNVTENQRITVQCDEGEHFMWFAYTKTTNNFFGDNDRAFVGVPNNIWSYPEGSVRPGSELRYEWLKLELIEMTSPGFAIYRCQKIYYAPDDTKLPTDIYETLELPLTPVSRNYLRFDATTNDVHIGVSNKSYFTNLEYTIDYDETWDSFPTSGVDVKQGHKLFLRGTGTSVSNVERTFTTSDLVECHGNVLSLVNKDRFETQYTLAGYRFKGLFKNSKITTAPELPVTQFNGQMPFSHMFQNCTELIEAPEIKVTTLTSYGCQYMFAGCTKLVKGPSSLPATSLQSDCYRHMFNGCTSLTDVPSVLPATTLTTECYNYMFANCTSLTTAPEISGFVLYTKCCQNMFSGCTSLTKGPSVLSASTMAQYCYDNMFYKCENLREAPRMPIVVALNSYCFRSMFMGCSKITEVDINISADHLYNNCFDTMFAECTSLTTAPEIRASQYISTTTDRCFIGMFQFCRNLTNVQDTFYFTEARARCCENMFNQCTSLTKAPTLIATTLGQSCYDTMFYGCTSLTEVQDTLPALDLASASKCYRQMFSNCTSLEKGPSLPASTLGEECYAYMFSGSGITEAPNLRSANVMRRFCYDNMFSYCANLREAPDLPAQYLDMYCYQGMFSYCYNLVKAPDILPATNLDYQCYRGMFSNCTNLQQAPNLPATVVGEESYDNMFQGCTNLNTIFCMAMYNYDYTEITDNIGRGWLQDAGTWQSNKTFYKNPSWNGPTERTANTILGDWEIENYPM